MYLYQSPVGLMEIKYDRSNNRFLLLIEGLCYGAYDSAPAAAHDVYAQTTGFCEWDLLDAAILKPAHLDEWEKK
jgi:hypothetical protein